LLGRSLRRSLAPSFVCSLARLLARSFGIVSADGIGAEVVGGEGDELVQMALVQMALVLRESVQTASMYSWNWCDLLSPFFLWVVGKSTFVLLAVVGQHNLQILSTYTAHSSDMCSWLLANTT
jgi:hypothetical protein